MIYQTDILANGLRIISSPMPASQSVTVLMAVGVGGRHEIKQADSGTSHFLEHLLFKGTPKRPSWRVIAEAIDGVGGINNATTFNDATSFYIKLPKQHYDLAVDILADIIRHPLLDPVEIDREREVIVEELHMRRDDSSIYVQDIFPQLLWPNDPLGRDYTGTEETVRQLPRDTIAAFQKAHYQAKNMVVSIAGDISHDHILKTLELTMGDMPSGRVTPTAKLKPELSPSLVKAIERPAAAQAHLNLGCQAFAYDHRLDIAAKLMTNLLGVGMSSRLFLNVRERLGLAYNIYASYNNYIDTGVFEIYAGVNSGKVEQALEAILAELAAIRKQPVSTEELTKVKYQISGNLQMALENTYVVAQRLGMRYLLTGRAKSLDQSLAEIKAVTVEEVWEAAQALLEPERLRLSLIAPSGKGATQKFNQLIKGAIREPSGA